MTVAEIQNYIYDLLYKNNQIPIEETNWQGFYYRHKIIEIRDMLDELEPKENTSQWTQHYKICGYVCDNCGHISEIKDDVCSNCGARMIDELKGEKNEHI